MRKELVDSFDVRITYVDSPEVRDEVFRRCLEFFERVEAFSGESICQCDQPQIEAPDFLASLCDEVFKFEQEWKE